MKPHHNAALFVLLAAAVPFNLAAEGEPMRTTCRGTRYASDSGVRPGAFLRPNFRCDGTGKECVLPTAAQLSAELNDFKSESENRVRLIRSSVERRRARARGLTEPLVELAGESPGTRFASFYLDAAHQIESKFGEPSRWAQDLDAVAASSEFVRLIEEALAKDAEYRDKIKATSDEDYKRGVEMVRRKVLEPKIADLICRADEIASTLATYDDAQPLGLVDRAMQFHFSLDGDCRFPSARHPDIDVILGDHHKDEYFDLLADASLIKKILDGPNGRPLTLVCRDVQWYRTVDYDRAAHAFINDYHLNHLACRQIECMTGRYRRYALEGPAVIGYLREKL